MAEVPARGVRACWWSLPVPLQVHAQETTLRRPRAQARCPGPSEPRRAEELRQEKERFPWKPLDAQQQVAASSHVTRFIPDFLHEKNLSDLSHWNEPRMQMSEPEEPREVEKPREKESVMDAISKQTHLIEGSKPVSFLRDPYTQRSLKNKEFRRSSHDLLTKVYLAREVSAALHNLIKCNTGTNTSPKLRADSSAQGQTVLDGKQIPVG